MQIPSENVLPFFLFFSGEIVEILKISDQIKIKLQILFQIKLETAFCFFFRREFRLFEKLWVILLK